MSRSRRKNPAGGATYAHTEKYSKRHANRALRVAARLAILADREPPLMREISDVWAWPKDGKVWWGSRRHRFAAGDFERLMRK